MPRHMSFAITTEQARNKTKTVTRRLGWWFLNKGDLVWQVEKGMGLKKGEKVKKIHLIKIVSTRSEHLYDMVANFGYGLAECHREGFPKMFPDQFVDMFCRANRCKPDVIVNRIEFDYATEGADNG